MSSTNFTDISNKRFKELKRLSDNDSLSPEDFGTARIELVDYGDMSNDEFDSMAAKNKLKTTNLKGDFLDELKSRSEKGLLSHEVLGQAKEELGKYEGLSGGAFDRMVAGGQISPSNVRLDSFNKLKGLSEKGSLTPEIYEQTKKELEEYAGVSPELFDSTMAKNKIGPSNAKLELLNKMKALSKRGALTPEEYGQTREKLEKEGVSRESFDKTMEKNRIRPSNFATAPKSSSPEEAAQNVLFELEHGSGLKAMAIKNNDPNYKEYVRKHGSAGLLTQPARRVGPESTKYRNAERRLRRRGYTKQAGEMALQRELVRMGEPRIDTPELRRQRMAQKIQAGREAQRQDKAYADSAKPSFFQNITGGLGITKKEKKEDLIPKRSFIRKKDLNFLENLDLNVLDELANGG